jgi:hypothetical protein
MKTPNRRGATDIPSHSGYELFFDGRKVGSEPRWTLEQAESNCHFNMDTHKDKVVDCEFDGRIIGARGTSAKLHPDDILPGHLQVRPIFFVPKDQEFPTLRQRKKLNDLVIYVQSEYKRILGQGKTFDLFPGDGHISVARGLGPISDYKVGPDGKRKRSFVQEALDWFGVNRYNSPYNFVIVMMTGELTQSDFDASYGTSINGGFNTGMGFLSLNPWFLETLQPPSPLDPPEEVHARAGTLLHELGHSFGLTHPDAYGKSLSEDLSFMSYNPVPRINQINPEDACYLAMNQRAFPGLEYKPLVGDIVRRPVTSDFIATAHWLTPLVMDASGVPQPYVTTTVDIPSAPGADKDSVLDNRGPPIQGKEQAKPDLGSAWLSAEMRPGSSATFSILFPFQVAPDHIEIRTGMAPGGRTWAADRVEVSDDHGKAFSTTAAADQVLATPSAHGKRWTIALHAPGARLYVRKILFSKAGRQFIFWKIGKGTTALTFVPGEGPSDATDSPTAPACP